jgi:hypothetical protein
VIAELVSRKVAIIIAGNAPAAVAAGKATRAIPIVLAAVNDPMGLGVADGRAATPPERRTMRRTSSASGSAFSRPSFRRSIG